MEKPMKKKLIDLTVLEDFLESGVSAVALVEEPAIEVDFFAFKKEKFVTPRGGEDEGEFIGRCMSALEGEFPEQDQRLAVCYSYWQGGFQFQSYDDYPEAAKNNAQRALDWAAENGWGSCGTPVGKIRANQLAKGEPISEDTISRMASFARHRQNSDTPYGEGCGGLMWDAWGGDAGVEWAQRKLEQIKEEKFQIEPNPCWEGYEPIGLKPGRGGAMVPNCVPVEALALMYEYQTDLPLFETPEAAIDYALNVYGCNGYHEHTLDGKTYYMPCETHPEDMEIVVNAPPYVDQTGESKKKRKTSEERTTGVNQLLVTKPVLMEQELLAYFSLVGITEDDFKMEFANAELMPWQEGDIQPADGAGGRTYYKYVGPRPQREFCRQMMALNRLYTFDEVETASNFAVNPGFGADGSAFYDIWKYKGGPNCKHYWQKMYATLDKTTNKGPAVGKAGVPMYDQPNNGYLMNKLYFEETKDQRILVGPAMIPGLEIPRYNKETREQFYVQFSEEAVAKIMEKFMREQSVWNTNQDHDGKKPAETYIFESWIIEDPETDKAKTVYGYENLPKGTWMVKMRVSSDEVWKRVKNGELKGFSVEGDFITEEQLAEIEREKELMEKIREIVR